MVRLLDRYVLKEAALPFLLTILGFLIFFLLFLVGQLSQILIDRAVPAGTFLLLLLYRMPHLLMLALPVATLFAVFLVLGRLGHDRELIALQAGGVSPRRVIAPLLVAGLLLAAVDFGIGDRLAPWGNRQFLSLWLMTAYGAEGTPKIKDNTFFKGPSERFFYVRRYDEERGELKDVLIYDLAGELALQDGKAYPKVITAARARWSGDVWQLQEGFVHTFDDRGNLRYKSSFETMEIQVGEAIRQLTFEQRTPQEMSLGELAERIEAFRRVGRSPDALLVEYHTKIAVPLACFVFVLFGAPLSLLIGPGGRALGVIASILLVLLYQGVYFWTATVLGTRGDLPPAWGAWLPNLIFGLIGLGLTWKAERFGCLDLLERAKRLLPLALLPFILALSGTSTSAEPPEGPLPGPLELSAETITVSEAGTELFARGQVRARYPEGEIEAERLHLSQGEGESWKASAEGARFKVGELLGSALSLSTRFVREEGIVHPEEIRLVQSASVRFRGGQLAADELQLARSPAGGWEVEASGDVLLQQEGKDGVTRAGVLRLSLVEVAGPPVRWRAVGASVEDFQGATDFVNADGERHRLRFRGERAQITFDQENEIRLIDVTNGDFTTCTCQERVAEASYSVRAGRLLVRPEEVLVAFDVTLRAFGTPVFWAPAYLSPLGDLRQKYPFLPEIGRAAGRGWFLSWRIPFFFAQGTYGHALVDFYSRHGEVGTGLDLNYDALPDSTGGRLSFYRLVGPEEALSLDWEEHVKLGDGTRLDLSAGVRTGHLALKQARLLTGAILSGSEGGWSWRLNVSRDENLLGEKPDPEELRKLRYRVLERFPELALDRRPGQVGELPLQLAVGAEWGRYREVDLEGAVHESSRLDGRLGLDLTPIALAEGARFQAGSGYRFTVYELERRESWELRTRLALAPVEPVSVSIEHLYRAVWGQSPFRFDRLSLSNLSSLKGSWRLGDWGELRAGTAYRLPEEALDRLNVRLSAPFGRATTSLGLELDPNRMVASQATVQGGLDGDGWQLSLAGGYRFPEARFQDLIAKLDLGAPLRAGLRVDLDRLALRRVNLESRWAVEDWELRFGSEYDLEGRRLTALQLGLVKKFCHACWQIGIYGSLNEFSVRVRINAFPTAEVSYSPTDQSLTFGQ